MEEEIDLRIFDFLEGNLSAEEAAAVQYNIDTLPDWNRVHRLMKLTYPAPELLDQETEAVFPHKERLYRRERGPRVFSLYFRSAAAAVLLIGAGYWLWRPEPSATAAARSLKVVRSTTTPAKENSRPSKPQTEFWQGLNPKATPGAGAIAENQDPISTAVVTELLEFHSSEPLSLRGIVALTSTPVRPHLAEQLRFINGNYIPINQRRSLLRYRIMAEGRELLAWVSEPRLMLVRTPRYGAKDHMELHLETRKIGIIATIVE